MATHSERMLPLLKQSAINNGINLEIFGMGGKWKNYGNKLNEISKYIENINNDEIVFFLDGFDTVILAPEHIILQRYNYVNNKIKDQRKKDLIFSNGRNFIRFVPELLLEINSGLFIGKAGKMKSLFRKIKEKCNLDKEGSCDVILEEFKRFVYIDNKYELFYNYYFDGFVQSLVTRQEAIQNISVKNKVLTINENSITTYPIAIHFPKNSINKNLLLKLGYPYNVKIESSVSYLIRDYIRHYNEYVLKYIIGLIAVLYVYSSTKS